MWQNTTTVHSGYNRKKILEMSDLSNIQFSESCPFTLLKMVVMLVVMVVVMLMLKMLEILMIRMTFYDVYAACL